MGDQDNHIQAVQGDHQERKYVFPEERWGKKILAEYLVFPDCPGDHDGDEAAGFDENREGCQLQPAAGQQIMQHQTQADQKYQELYGG